MKFYIDCVSGYAHLIELSNQLYKDKNKVEELRILRLFEQCYFKGAVPSVCGRMVIDVENLINNLNECVKNLETDLCVITTLKILELAFRGIWDNCALPDDRFYVPATTIAPLK